MGRPSFARAGQAALFVAAALLAACGGGGGGSTAPAIPVPTLTPPSSATSSVSVTPGGGSAALPSFGGYASSVTFPASNASGPVSVAATVSTSLPSGLPALQSGKRKPQSIATAVYLYVEFISPVPIAFNGFPGLTVTMPSNVNTSNQQFFIAAYANGAWIEPADGPATVQGQQVTFAAVASGLGWVLPANTPVFIALYGAPAPTPAPATPSASYMTQTSATKVNGAIGAGATSAVVAEISSAADPVATHTTFNLDSLTLGTGASAQSFARSPQSALSPVSRSFTMPRQVSVPEHQVPGDALIVNRLRLQMRHVAGTRRFVRSSSIPATLVPGTTTANFWVQNSSIGTNNGSYQQVAMTLEVQTTHGNIWIDNSLLSDSRFTSGSVAATASQIAAVFENAYASDTQHFAYPEYVATTGALANGGNAGPLCDSTGASAGTGDQVVVPADPRINVAVLDVQSLGSGVGGYFSGINYFTQAAVNCLIGHNYTASTVPKSNEAPMFFVGYNSANSSNFELNEDLVRGTAHEFQHLINFANRVIINPSTVGEDAFVNEGLSMLAQDFAVHSMFNSVPFDVADALQYRALTYLDAPSQFSLTGFSGIDPPGFSEGTAAMYNCGGGCYGSAYLFQRYLYDRCGGDNYTHQMESAGLGGGANILHACGTSTAGEAFGDLVADFGMALASSSAGVTGDPKFSFGTLGLTSTYTDQFGQRTALPGIFATPLGTSGTLSSLVPVGGINFVSLSPIPATGEPLGITDAQTTAGFALKGGLIQH